MTTQLSMNSRKITRIILDPRNRCHLETKRLAPGKDITAQVFVAGIARGSRAAVWLRHDLTKKRYQFFSGKDRRASQPVISPIQGPSVSHRPIESQNKQAARGSGQSESYLSSPITCSEHNPLSSSSPAVPSTIRQWHFVIDCPACLRARSKDRNIGGHLTAEWRRG